MTDVLAQVAIIGGGPAGLIAAETLIEQGVSVDLYDRMPSAGRKFLIAGKGGLNLTHSEPFPEFLKKYGEREIKLSPYLTQFGPTQIQQWAKQYGINTFIGTSGRVFPVGMKAAPLLYAWKTRLIELGVTFLFRHEWTGFAPDGSLIFKHGDQTLIKKYQAVLFAMGGASWSRTGSKGDWVPIFEAAGIKVDPFKPSNCGFDVLWTDHFKSKFDGNPLKTIQVGLIDAKGELIQKKGEFIVTHAGLEGSLIYALSAKIRSGIEQNGQTTIYLDLLPDLSTEELFQRLSKERGKRSFSSFLEKTTGLNGVKLGLLWEFIPREDLANPEKCAQAIKHLPITLTTPHPLEEAISSAGGVDFEEMDDRLMLKKIPGVFCAGEMLDWEAPTGGYLITACFATGVAAANGILSRLKHQ